MGTCSIPIKLEGKILNGSIEKSFVLLKIDTELLFSLYKTKKDVYEQIYCVS